MSGGLVEFLRARLDEDEAVASYALTRPGPDHNESPGGYGGWWLGHYQHARRFDPPRILEEVEAKRRIVEDRGWIEHGPPYGLSIFGERVLGLLALPYADHPDYREEWKPHITS